MTDSNICTWQTWARTTWGLLEMLFGLWGSITRKVFLPVSRGSRLPPSPTSTWYAPFKCCSVSSVMWTRLFTVINTNSTSKHIERQLNFNEFIILGQISRFSHPGRPPDSMWLANVTSCDHTSYCHFCKPITPLSTLPVWTPTRMLISTPVASRSLLQGDKSESSQNHTVLFMFRTSCSWIFE